MRPAVSLTRRPKRAAASPSWTTHGPPTTSPPPQPSPRSTWPQRPSRFWMPQARWLRSATQGSTMTRSRCIWLHHRRAHPPASARRRGWRNNRRRRLLWWRRAMIGRLIRITVSKTHRQLQLAIVARAIRLQARRSSARAGCSFVHSLLCMLLCACRQPVLHLALRAPSLRLDSAAADSAAHRARRSSGLDRPRDPQDDTKRRGATGGCPPLLFLQR